MKKPESEDTKKRRMLMFSLALPPWAVFAYSSYTDTFGTWWSIAAFAVFMVICSFAAFLEIQSQGGFDG